MSHELLFMGREIMSHGRLSSHNVEGQQPTSNVYALTGRLQPGFLPARHPIGRFLQELT
jgi:hypothetical protein